MQFVVETIAEAQPEVAFQTAADIVAWPQFISGIAAVELLTPGAVGLGLRFRETRVMFGRRASEEMTVAALDPPRRLVLTAHNHGTAYRVEHEFAPEFAPGAGATRTRITLTFEGRPVTLLARALAPLGLLASAGVRRQLQADLRDLAHEAERRQRAARA